MKDDFFEYIDSKEKAYWLGFIYAEGYIETRDQKPYRLGIEISKDDEILIDRFIEALDIDPNRKYYREKYHTVIVKFVNKTIVKDLVNLSHSSANFTNEVAPAIREDLKNFHFLHNFCI